MKIFRFCVGAMGTNCYMVTGDTNEALVIDPGADADKILTSAAEKGLKITKIVLTHVHFDHIMAVNEIIEKTGAELYVHPLDKPALTDTELNLSGRFSGGYTVEKEPVLISEGDNVTVGNAALKVMHTPGHTPGSIILISGDTIFCGDTVFCGCIGRYDFPGGDYDTIMKSVEKISALDGDYKLLPGHDRSTTLEYERQTNIYFG